MSVVRYTLIALFVLYSGWVIIREEGGDEYRRELLMASSLDEQLHDQIEQHKIIVTDVPFDGILTSEWCLEPSEPPIPYDRCRYDDKYSILFRFGVYGGLTNALHFILKGAIWAMEEGVCFYVSEHGKILIIILFPICLRKHQLAISSYLYSYDILLSNFLIHKGNKFHS